MHFTRITLLLGCIAFASACGPDYPSCDTDADCHASEVCVDGQCQQCRGDTDCPAGQSCNAGACVAAPSCSADGDCPAGQACRAGRCQPAETASESPAPESAPVSTCSAARVYFDLDSSSLGSSQRETLSSYAECPGAASAGAIVVTGMTDPRGTEEYNLVLGERRAQVVKAYLERLGLAHDHVHARSVGEEFATGQDESAWSQERAASLEAR